MRRFQRKKQHHFIRNMLLSLLLFFVLLTAFYRGVSSLSAVSAREQEATLRSAITEGAVHCYAVRGYYPQNLDTLIEDYGITYDREEFFVDYQPQGENIMPEITVIRKGE